MIFFICHGFSMYRTTKMQIMIGSDWSPTKRELDGLANVGIFKNLENTNLTSNLMLVFLIPY